MRKSGQSEEIKENITIFCFYTSSKGKEENVGEKIQYVSKGLRQEEWESRLAEVTSEKVMLVDGDRVGAEQIRNIESVYRKNKSGEEVYYVAPQRPKLLLGFIQPGWFAVDRDILASTVFIGKKETFRKAYAGVGLAQNPMEAIGYSLQKQFVRFRLLDVCPKKQAEPEEKTARFRLFWNYGIKLPFVYLLSGAFSRELFQSKGQGKREMVFRMLMLFFAVFCYFYMPYISRDYGISGDEQIDDQQATYVLNYFSKGDKTALNQPRTLLHLYGSSVQVVIKAVSNALGLEDVYAFRHIACSLIGAWGIWIVGLLGVRLGGGLCGLLAMLMMFLTPRYLGHSMNNLKDVPFAVGYVLAVYYFIRLFDRYPRVKLSAIIGSWVGIFLALGTRSGGLILFPYLFMYGGLFYIGRVGVKEFYKFITYRKEAGRILLLILIVLAGGYILSILLWPYALQKPLTNVVVSMQQFTHINTGIRTIFDGKQMMSNMLPPIYAPKYLAIGMPVVVVFGVLGYLIYLAVRRKEFSLVTFFVLFGALFPVFWVVYQNSNLYGGIRHLLFVMPLLVILAAAFWSSLMRLSKFYAGIVAFAVWVALAALPFRHIIRNHPNEYIYFNELVGGLKGVYGDFETDYYFNSLKQSYDWFKKNVDLPKDRKTVIVTQFVPALNHYFRKDTNVVVKYSRYYEKYSKDWDYAIFGNVYINRFQLQHQLFPIEGTLFSSTVDGLPMSFVAKRPTKEDLEGFELERQHRYKEALEAFENYVKKYPRNEEVWGKMAKVHYLMDEPRQALQCVEKALELHPYLGEALFISVLAHNKLEDYPKALTEVAKMFSENSSSPDAYYLKSLTYFNMKKYAEAINTINKGLSYRPDDSRMLGIAGDIMRMTGHYKEAADIYKRILNTNKKDVNAMVFLADSYCRLKDFRQCSAVLNDAMKLRPDFFPVYKVLARMYYMQNRIAQMGQILSRMNAIDSDAELFVLRGYYFNALQDAVNAERMFTAALQLDPENQEAQKFKNK